MHIRRVLVSWGSVLLTITFGGCSRIDIENSNVTIPTTSVGEVDTPVEPVPDGVTTTLLEAAGTAPDTTLPDTTATTGATTSSVTVTEGSVTRLVPDIVNRYPHDPTAFTQGLEWLDGLLVEGIGEYGRSARRLVEPSTGRIVTQVALPLEQFGNGLTVHDGTIVHLTWRAQTAHLAATDTLEAFDRFTYEGEGWGLCSDGERFVMSNGSDELVFRDPGTFVPIGSVRVAIDGQPVSQLNELECVDGRIWANVWLTSQILQIDPTTGAVLAVVDASSLLPPTSETGADDVLNGIAHRAETDTFFVTGKRWADLYEIRLVPAP